MKFKPYIRKVNYYETDRMSIVHHSNYIRYFEEARIYAMEQIGCDLIEMERQNMIIPVVDVYAKYHKSLCCLDEIRFTSDNSLACTGHSTHCFVNENHKPISIKRTNPEIYNKFMSAVEE